MRTENCENLCMKQFASSILAFSRITIQNTIQQIQEKKEKKKQHKIKQETHSQKEQIMK